MTTAEGRIPPEGDEPLNAVKSMKPWLLLAGAIVMEVPATLALRATVDRPAWVRLVIVGYGGAFVCLALELREGTIR